MTLLLVSLGLNAFFVARAAAPLMGKLRRKEPEPTTLVLEGIVVPSPKDPRWYRDHRIMGMFVDQFGPGVEVSGFRLGLFVVSGRSVTFDRVRLGDTPEWFWLALEKARETREEDKRQERIQALAPLAQETLERSE